MKNMLKVNIDRSVGDLTLCHAGVSYCQLVNQSTKKMFFTFPTDFVEEGGSL